MSRGVLERKKTGEPLLHGVHVAAMIIGARQSRLAERTYIFGGGVECDAADMASSRIEKTPYGHGALSQSLSQSHFHSSWSLSFLTIDDIRREIRPDSKPRDMRCR